MRGNVIEELEAGVVVSLGKDAADFKLAMDRCRRAYLNTNPKHAEKTFESIQISGQPWYRIREESGLPVTWGFHGDYFVAAVGQNAVEGILGRMKSHPPAWWKAIRNQTPVESPIRSRLFESSCACRVEHFSGRARGASGYAGVARDTRPCQRHGTDPCGGTERRGLHVQDASLAPCRGRETIEMEGSIVAKVLARRTRALR